MPHPIVTVVVPTLRAGKPLAECLRSLANQTHRDLAVIIVDNSGDHRVARELGSTPGIRILANRHNVGFGAAINQGGRSSQSPYVATLNDDAVASPAWLASLVSALDANPSAGMCASRVILQGTNQLDSAGMLLCADGSSKQRGNGLPPRSFDRPEEVLLPSGSAAIYRRAMLDDIGWFDESFFLYVEDTDLGLRGRWAGWKCLYAPDAVVAHQYSQSAGKASTLKAYYVERNRLFLVIKTFPPSMLAKVPFFALARYFWHLASMFRGHGAAAKFRQSGHSPFRIPWILFRAHLAALANLPSLWRRRREIFRRARISSRDFLHLSRVYSISPREVASQ